MRPHVITEYLPLGKHSGPWLMAVFALASGGVAGRVQVLPVG
jgi:hypothetical protein